MKRREFITLVGGAAAAWPLAARAQQARIYTIGVLTLSSPNPEPLLEALGEGLRGAGYVEGRNLRLEIRSAAGRPASPQLGGDRLGISQRWVTRETR
jgi:hypothetical protein